MDEKVFQHMVENARDALLIFGLNREIKYYSPQLPKMFGFEEISKTKWLDLVHKDDVPRVIDSYNQTIKAGSIESIPILEFRVRTNDGNYIWISTSSKDYFNEKGELIGYISSVRDISERKQLEQELRESEEKFRTISEKNVMGIMISQGYKLRYFNDEFSRIYECPKEEILKMKSDDLFEFVHVDDRERVMEWSQKLIQKKIDPRVPLEHRILTRTGKIKWLESYGKHISYKGSEAILAIMIDISKRKEVEQDLKESENKLKLISEHANDLICIIGKGFLFEYINEHAYKETLGYSKEDLIGKSAFKLVHPDDQNFVAKQFFEGNLLEEGSIETRFRHKDGHYVWVSTKGSIFKTKSGGRKALLTTRDITIQKKLQDELRESEEKFRTITEHSSVSIVIIQDGLIRYINESIMNKTGYTVDEVLNWTFEEFIKAIHPDDIPFVLDQVRKKQRGDQDIITNYSFRIITKSGEIRWVENYGKTISYGGRPADLSVLIDITDKMIAEQKLKESEEKFRNISEQSLMGIVMIEDEFINYFNDAALNILEIQSKDYINKNVIKIMDIITPNHRSLMFKDFQARKEGHLTEPKNSIIEIETPSKKSKWIDV
ncbi:MAG: PAS domain S-box protein, partial [Candidatus Helarchaeota archaeon]